MNYTIVVAEDEILLLNNLVQKIEKLDMGFTVVGKAQTGIQALSLVDEYSPFLLITDIRMPVMDGITLVEKVHETHPDTDCIIVSGYSDFEYAQAAIHLGVREYLLKPINVTELSKVLGKLKTEYAAKQQEVRLSFSENPDEVTTKNVASLVHEYIHQHYAEEINLNLLAASFNYSPSYLTKIFFAKYNQAPSHYLTRLRMQKARQLLSSTDYSVHQIGVSVGYPDQSYFSRFFKKHVGVSPQKYRDEHAGEQLEDIDDLEDFEDSGADSIGSDAAAAHSVVETGVCYEPYTFTFQGPDPGTDHVRIDLTGEFTYKDQTYTVKGFYGGDETYYLRFLPLYEGQWAYQISGLFEQSGVLEISGTAGHGPVRADGIHFQYHDGTSYAPFGTTVYALAHQPEVLIEQTTATLKSSPFNKVRHCVFPKHYDYNHNDPELYPFERNPDGSWDVLHPCFAFWDHLEQIITDLGNSGIQTDLILFHPYDRWGFARMNMDENRLYLEYALRRLSSVPYIWWSLANEYDFVFDRPLEDWYQLEEYVHDNDPYGHLLSCHNGIRLYDFDRPNITHLSVQTAAMHMASYWMNRYSRPVVYDECCYEGDIQHAWGNISAQELVNRFWKAAAQGAYATHGETYLSEDGILWWSRGGALKGESPARIDFLRTLLESLPGAIEPWIEARDSNFSSPELAKFAKLKSELDPMDRANLEWKDAVYAGHIGEQIYIKYLGEQQPQIMYFNLPEKLGQTYRIEVIDAWNMTRIVAAEHVHGRNTVRLKGRQYVALLAIAEENNE